MKCLLMVWVGLKSLIHILFFFFFFKSVVQMSQVINNDVHVHSSRKVKG